MSSQHNDKVHLIDTGTDNETRIHICSEFGTVLQQELDRHAAGSSLILLTDSNVYEAWGKLTEDVLIETGCDFLTYIIEPGEASKNFTEYGKICETMAEHGLDRSSIVISLGGGVISDLGGFVASTYMRGIRHIIVSTSLLGQVDASIGGKTGVDLKAGKNLAGTFYQPISVISATHALSTLNDDEFVGGMAEVIKYGCIASESLFDKLALMVVLQRDSSEIFEIIAECAGIKVSFVERDEKEANIRAALNFGHTVGHAIEKASAYAVSHGQAVAAGMLAVTKASVACGLTPDGVYERLQTLLAKYELPAAAAWAVSFDDVLDAIEHDKKKRNGNITFVTLDKIGAYRLHSLPLTETAAFLQPAASLFGG